MPPFGEQERIGVQERRPTVIWSAPRDLIFLHNRKDSSPLARSDNHEKGRCNKKYSPTRTNRWTTRIQAISSADSFGFADLREAPRQHTLTLSARRRE